MELFFFFFTEKPREYLIAILEKLRIAKATGVAFPFFMDHSNITAMFDMMDSSKKGTISFVQYKEGQYLLPTEVIARDHSITHSS